MAFEIPSWEQINRALGLGKPLSTSANNAVVGGEAYDSHIQDYYAQQSDMLMRENTMQIGKIALIGVSLLAVVYIIKKRKGK